MATYVIGDVQGCFDSLIALLKLIDFDERQDTLWLTGDLVNRGPKSLEVLRFISQLPKAISVLGNHDLTLLALAYTDLAIEQPTLNAILEAPDREFLLTWLRHCPLIYSEHQHILVHAGIAPQWTIHHAKLYAKEVEQILRSDHFASLLRNMFGNLPNHWTPTLTGWDRNRYIINACTRLRFCDLQGNMELTQKGKIETAPHHLYPWFKLLPKDINNQIILFGHWAALNGFTNQANVIALDTGCVWGRRLTALRLEDYKLFSIASQETHKASI